MIEPQAPEKDQRYVEPMILTYGRDPKTGIPGLMCSSDNGPDGKKYDETDAKRIMKAIAVPLQELIAQEVQKALAAQNGGETN